MIDIPNGLSFDETDDGFVVQRKNADGIVASIVMSAEEVFGFRETIDFWIDRILSRRQAESGEVQPIIAFPVVQARVLPDAIQANVLLTTRGPSGQERTMQLAPGVARHIATEIDDLLLRFEGGRQYS